MRQRLEIPPGINTDDTAYRYPGAWRSCDKVRFWKGSPEVIGGWETAVSTPLMGVCRSLLSWVDSDRQANIAYGLHNGLQVSQGAVLYDITPTTGFTAGAVDGTGGAGYGTGSYNVGAYSEPSVEAFFPLTWSLSNWGNSLMANPRGQTIFWWQNDTATPAAILSGSPASVNFMLVTPTRQVMAFGCNEEISGTFNSMAIRFSDIEDPEEWTTASDNNAGEVILAGSGNIICARQIGEYIFVWTNNSLYQGSFTGDTTNPWVFTKLGDNCGICGPNAVSIVSQTAYWFSNQDRFMYCTIGGVPTIMPLMVGDEMADHVTQSQNDKIVSSPISKFNEVWWFYPDNRDGSENSRYVSVSLSDGAASQGILPRTAFQDTASGSNLYPVGTTTDGVVYYHEKGNTADSGSIDWYIETSDFFIDEEERCTMVRSAWPDFQRQIGIIRMTVTGLQYPQSVPEVFSDQRLSANTTKVDFRYSGRLVRVKLAGNSSPAEMRLGIMTFDVVPAGNR